jgi:S1-C subfamily serine protease
MRRLLVAGVMACVFGAATALPAQSPEERTTARDVVRRKAEAVVMVMATLKIRANVGGQEQQVEQQAQANGTILDASGLTVLSLSTLQPDDMMARSLSARTRPGTRVDVISEPSNVRMRTGDGREIAARLVLRDEDLDLAFIKPIDPPSPAVTWVDGPAAKPSLLDLLFVIQRTTETSGFSTAATFGNVQLVVDKPRLYFQAAMAGNGASALGSPVFDASGRFVGVIVMRSTGSRGPSLTAILPADDIRDIAKQAP